MRYRCNGRRGSAEEIVVGGGVDRRDGRRRASRGGGGEGGGITIRLCGPGDAEPLALVGQATFLQSYAEVLPGEDILAHCRREHARELYDAWLADPGVRIWIAETATGAPVGYVTLNPPDLPIPTGPDDVEIKRIYLLHRFHGAGLGARLMAAAVAGAQGLGRKRILLGVFSRNTPALAFYARQGFAQAGVRRFQVGANQYDDYVLARAVDPAAGA